MFVPINFPSVFALDQWGLRIGVLVGMALTTFGLMLRCLINYSFLYAIIGQTIMSIGQPFIINACPKISANWFHQKERIVATSVAAYANIFGVALGCFVPSIFFEDNDVNLPDEAKKHCFKMNLYLTIIATVIMILSLILFKDKPKNL